jgi:multiple sugar transport system permease protein
MSRGTKRTQRSGWSTGLWFCLPSILGLLLFTAYPVIASLVYSLCRYSVMRPPAYVGTANYAHLAHDELFWKSLANTAVYAIIAVPAGIVVAFCLALLLNMKVRGMPLYRTFFYVPSIVPLVASSVLWRWLFNPQSGAINAILRPILTRLHHILPSFPVLDPPGWLADPLWAKPAIILWSVWGVGGAIVIYLAGLQDVPQELYEAAEVDGAGAWAKTRRITIPFMSPHLLFTFIMGLIGAFQFFTPAFVMSNGTGGPADSTLFYSLYLFQVAFSDFKMGYACALAWILFLLIVIATFVVFKTSARHVYYAGGDET